MQLSFKRVLGAALILSGLIHGAFGQTNTPASQQPASGQKNEVTYQSQTILRATTRLVVLDVVALDEKGQPITGLKADDFTVLEDGKPQKISDFSFHQPGKDNSQPNQPAPGVISNSPQYSSNSCLNVILLDAINTEFSNHVYAQDMLVKYLETNPVLQPTAIFAMQQKLVMLHDFTTDTKALRDVVAHFQFQGPEHIADVYTAASPFQRRGSFKATGNARAVTESSMLFLARSLAGYPGRKNLIWLSEGFPLSLFPDFTAGDDAVMIVDFSPMAERIADELMNAQVALYPIDAAGVSINDRFPARTAMESMSERTGGKTFYNRNDIDTGIRTSLDDGSTYYTLEYYPQNRVWNAKFRRIELKLSQPHSQLRYREGYYGLGPNGGSGSDSQAFGRALDREAPTMTAVHFQASIKPPSAQTPNQIQVNFGVDPHSLAFQKEADDLWHANVSCVVWAYPQKGEPIRAEGESKAAVKEDVYQQIIHGYFPCHRELSLKSGRYTLRLGVMDQSTSLIGTMTTQVSIP